MSEDHLKKPNLIIQTAFLGDLFLTIPLLKRVKSWDKDRPLFLLCKKGLGDSFRFLKLVDLVIEVDKKDSRSWRKAKQKLMEYSYSILISPHESVRTAFLVRKLKADTKIGYFKWWNKFFFDQRVFKPIQFPEVIRQLYLLNKMDSELSLWLDQYQNSFHEKESRFLPEILKSSDFRYVPSWASMSICLEMKDLERVNYIFKEEISNSLLKINQIIQSKKIEKPIAFAPGSVWGTKRWTIEGYIKLGKLLEEQGYQVLIVGAPDEKWISDQILQSLNAGVSVVGELSVFESLLILSQSQALVSNDCGAMHMAAALEIPNVAVFGPTTLNLGFRPWQNRAIVVQNNSLSCRPCGKHGPQKCPLGTHDCMKSISPQSVLSALKKVLNEKLKWDS